MEEAGLDLDDSEKDVADMEESPVSDPSPREESLEDLQRRLDEAIATENYELASELKKRIDEHQG